MTDPWVMAIAVMAVIASVVAAVFLQPRRPRLDPEAAFKAALRARLVAAGWSPADQVACAPYHPLGRMPERLIAHPGIETVPGPHREGFAAFVDELAGLPDPVARWARWRGPSPEVPSEQSPRARLGPSFDDGSLADGRAAAEAERRWRLRWRWVRGASPAGVPDVACGADGVVDLGALLPSDGPSWETLALLDRDLRAVAHATPMAWALVGVWGAAWSQVAFDELVTALGDRWREERPTDGTRWLLGVTGAATPVVLSALADDAGLRDVVAGVVSVGGVVGGRLGEAGAWGPSACEDRLARDFKHAFLDTEVVQVIPWGHLVWMDPTAQPPGAGDLGAGAQRWPPPGFEGREPAFVEVQDLGALDPSHVPDPADVREAVRVTMDLIVGTRVWV